MIQKLLDSLQKVRSIKQNQWTACCPAHADNSPSLGIKLCDNGKILLHCFGGCSANDIVGVVGMELSDLFPPSDKIEYESKQKRQYFNAQTILICLRKESLLLSIAAQDILDGTVLPEDAKRIEIARQKIAEAATYCGKYGD